MFGKDIIARKETFLGLKPGTPEWLNYWIAHPDQQNAMIAYSKLKHELASAAKKILQANKNNAEDNMPIVNKYDSVIAYADTKLIHKNWPHLGHRRVHVFVLSPDRRSLITRLDASNMWSSAATVHVLKDENYFKAAVRAIRDQLGHNPFKGRLRDIYYESEPTVLTDYEATTVFEYVLPNMHGLESDNPIRIVYLKRLDSILKDRSGVSGLFRRLVNVVLSTGDIQWKT